MKTTANTPVAAEIGRATVERVEILRARGRTSAQIAADLDLDVYVVDEVFAWHDALCGTDPTHPLADECGSRRPVTAQHRARRTRIPA